MPAEKLTNRSTAFDRGPSEIAAANRIDTTVAAVAANKV
jgi:hypothetical protein